MTTLIDVSGHTDPSGGDAINIPLSLNRAQSVASEPGSPGSSQVANDSRRASRS